jgi:putative ubiquitin-RnfH superfamily antitoxin RatB of RatAB toxin-antitoxin module
VTRLRVVVVYSPAPRQVCESPLQVAPGTTVAQALETAGLPSQLATCAVGIWGRRVDRAQVLNDLDRVEVYRELKVDPKVARRERFLLQGRRSAGLFVRPKIS